MLDYAAKGTVDWDGKKVTLEGSEEFVSTELERFRNAAIGTTAAAPEAESSKPTEDGRPLTDAAFVELKKPADHFEKIAVLAVKLAQAGTTEFTGDDMRRAYLRAGIKPPKVMTQALVDTKRHKDYIEPTQTRGAYRLTTFGSDFVEFDLPRDGKQK
ncbi:hypothetical protein [Granulicella sp. L46]|uniref:hypothetical protein n=1 Tax=Granulicella sp. L46 TaxID=1641865 RepID=UPI00131E097E|nr:hypothetical protein [Granulicella sp. L46]